MDILKRICVYCGSRFGTQPVYKQKAYQLGEYLAQHDIGIVYGGGSVGLMGALADAALKNGGEVIGVMPEALARREVAHKGLTELIILPDMHARKKKMMDLADAFLALPGGWGTLEELSEVSTWLQLGFHHHPIGVLNIAGYYDSLLAFFQQGTQEGFLPQQHLDLLQVSTCPKELVQKLEDSALLLKNRTL